MHLHTFPDPGGDILFYNPDMLTPSPCSSLDLTTCMGQHAYSKTSPMPCELDEAVPLTEQHILDSKEMLKGKEGQLLNSHVSAKTLCDSQDVVDRLCQAEVHEAQTEQEGSVSTDLIGNKALQRPDSLKGIQSFQKSHSDLASLGLAFPAQNSSMAVGQWPSITDHTASNDDMDSYTYSPGYDQTHSKASDR